MALVTKVSLFHEMFSCELTSLSHYSSMLFIIYYVTLFLFAYMCICALCVPGNVETQIGHQIPWKWSYK